MSDSVSPPKTPKSATMKKRNINKEKARTSVKYKNKKEDHCQMETREGIACKAPPAHTEKSTGESVDAKDKERDDLRENTQIEEDTASISNNEGNNAGNLCQNSRDEVDDMVSHKNLQHECGDDLKGNTSGVEDKVRPVHTKDNNREIINSKDKEGNDLIESMQTVADTESPIKNEEKM